MLPARLTIPLAIAFTFSFSSLRAQDWKPAQAALMTRWAKEVTPDKVHAEYPRPQMVRDTWQNLNGLWDYAITGKDAGKPDKWDGQILVPFPIESALSGVMKRVGPDKRLWYRRTFRVPDEAAWKDKRVLLHFGAVDWDTVAYVNGKEVVRHRGGYDPFSADITDALKAHNAGNHEIVLSVYDPTNAGFQPVGKQHNNPHGIWYTPVTGIWQTVWIEPVPKVHISSLRITPNVDAGEVTISARHQAEGTTTVKVEVLDGDKRVGFVETEFDGDRALIDMTPVTVTLPNARLWSPDSPFLYRLKITLEQNGRKDAVETYFAMRKISTAKDDHGVLHLHLNNKPLFQFGPLDQGWWPDGLYTAPTDDALRYDIEITKKLGFNMIRKHVKVEPARWYYHCDKLGMLVWQDMPNGDKGPPWSPNGEHNGKESQRSKESSDNYNAEWKAIIDALRNHPCIVMWVPFNEAWGQFDTVRVTEWTKKYDPTRLVNCASGGNDFPTGDVLDLHNYPGPAAPKPDGKRAIVLGEYGGLGLPVEGHTWLDKGNWGYRSFKTSEELTTAYIDLATRLRPLIHEPGLAAAVYTQTTDVEVEVNGFMTYDRAVMKMNLEKVAAANRKVYLPPPRVKAIVAAARKQAVEWRYTTAKPAAGWEKEDFDDSKWDKGPAGFGEPTTPNTAVRTQWKTNDIWIRRGFDLNEGKVDAETFMLEIHHDEDSEIFINGVLAAKVTGFTTDYTQVPISDAAKKALKPGKNTIAVHTHQTGGGQYIDVGIVDVVEQK